MNGNVDCDNRDRLDFAIDAWQRQSPINLAGGYTPEKSREAMDQEHKDEDILIAMGMFFIVNLNLPFRVQRDILLAPYDRATFYVPLVAEGYTDYPFSQEFATSKSQQ